MFLFRDKGYTMLAVINEGFLYKNNSLFSENIAYAENMKYNEYPSYLNFSDVVSIINSLKAYCKDGKNKNVQKYAFAEGRISMDILNINLHHEEDFDELQDLIKDPFLYQSNGSYGFDVSSFANIVEKSSNHHFSRNERYKKLFYILYDREINASVFDYQHKFLRFPSKSSQQAFPIFEDMNFSIALNDFIHSTIENNQFTIGSDNPYLPKRDFKMRILNRVKLDLIEYLKTKIPTLEQNYIRLLFSREGV